MIFILVNLRILLNVEIISKQLILSGFNIWKERVG